MSTEYIKPTPLTPEEEKQLRGTPLRTVRAREVDAKPPTPAEAARTRWRRLALGTGVAVGAGVVATLGYLLIRSQRKLRTRRNNA